MPPAPFLSPANSGRSNSGGHISIYTADNGTVFDALRRLFRDNLRSRHLVWEMLKRDLTSQYRQSLLGVFVSLLPALATTAWAVLFRSARLINVGEVSVPYPFFVLCGMMIWAVFTESLEAPISGIVAEQSLLSKAAIPPEAVAFARLGNTLVNFAVKMVVVAAAVAIYGIHLQWTAVLVFAGVIPIVALGAGLGLILAPINLLYRDVSRAVPVVTTFWFFLTPVIFVSPHEGLAAVVFQRLNPVTPLLDFTRNQILPGNYTTSSAFWMAIAFSMVLFFVGLLFHRIAMPVVIDRANA